MADLVVRDVRDVVFVERVVFGVGVFPAELRHDLVGDARVGTDVRGRTPDVGDCADGLARRVDDGLALVVLRDGGLS